MVVFFFLDISDLSLDYVRRFRHLYNIISNYIYLRLLHARVYTARVGGGVFAFMWNNHTRCSWKSESRRRPEDSSAIRCRFGHLARGVCVCVYTIHPLPRWIIIIIIIILRTTKLNESATEATSPEANFAKRTHAYI